MSRSRGEPMQGGLAAELSDQLGQAVDGVVLHRDGAAAEAAASINARAFSVNEHIFFGTNGYAPASTTGRRLIAHETTHVLQHQRGELRDGDTISSPGETLEREADRAAGSVALGRPHTLGGANSDGKPRTQTSAFVTPQAGARMMRIKDPKTNEDFGVKVTSAERIEDIKKCLANMGFDNSRRKKVVNDYTDTDSWTEQEVQDALDEIYKYITTKSRRLFDAWYVTQDDLRFYPNILTYIRRLNELSDASMGIGSYTDASLAMQNVYFAGNDFKVNPKAVYFVAAAQFAMDIQSDRGDIRGDQGSGHYIPMGAFRILIKDIYQDLATIVAGTGSKKDKHAVTGSKKAYDIMIAELQYMCNSIGVQKQIGASIGQAAHLHGEHRDPTMVAYLEARSKKINNLTPAKDDDDAQTQAQALLKMLSLGGTVVSARKFDVSDSQHSAPFAVDPHGTDHAMGMAVDLFKGKGTDKHEEDKRWSSGAFTNAGFSDQLSAYQLLIAKFGDDTEDYDPEQGYAPIPSTTKLIAFTSLSHEQARSLDRLAMERMDDLLEIIDGGDPNLATPFALRMKGDEIILLDGKLSKEDRDWIYNKRRKAISRYGAQQQSARLGFSVRASAFAKLLRSGPSIRAMGEPLSNKVAKEQVELEGAKANALFMGPQTLITTLEHRADELDEIVAAADLRRQVAEDDWAGEDSERQDYLEVRRNWLEYEGQREQKQAANAEELAQLSGKAVRARKEELDADLKKWKKDADGYGGAKKQWDTYRAKHKKTHSSASTINNTFAALHDAGPTAGTRNLRQIRAKVDGMFEMAVWAHAHMEHDRLENIKKKRSWSQSVGNPERGLYDQSSVMVRAIESVKSYEPTNEKPANPTAAGETDVRALKSGHHWLIGPTWDPEIAKQKDKNNKKTWNILTSESDYESALAQDMTQRQADSAPGGKSQLERIMEIMAETPAGQAVIDFDNNPPPGYKKAAEGYKKAMIQVLQDSDAFNQMRDRVRQRVVDPYRSSTLMDGKEHDLKTRMRMRGHYL